MSPVRLARISTLGALVLLVCAQDSPADVSPSPVVPQLGNLPSEVVEIASQARQLPLPERMAAVSAPFVGKPYISDPLGEGTDPDADPFARYDVFDCLTFVEEVLALSLSSDPVHSSEVRLSLRYGDATPSYATRRHFMELQWIPGNLEAGWLTDATASYGEVIRLERTVTAETWQGWSKRKRFNMTDEELPRGPMSLDVLPLEQAIKAVDQIRPGSILLTVRQDRPWVPIWVTHVAMTIPGEEPTVRHASRSPSVMKVRDEPLIRFLRRLRYFEKWPVVGVSILEPVEQGPRLPRHVPTPDQETPDHASTRGSP